MNAQKEIVKLKPKDGFKSHLIGNKHLLLSGKFGIGKTTFLKDYFKQHENDYLTIHLFPVNYSVAENKDVFELIKCDILYSLLDFIDAKKLEQVDSIYKTPLAGFIAENYDTIFFNFLKLSGALGKKLYEITKELKALKEQYHKYKEEEHKNLAETIEFFGDQYKDQIGHLYERDAFTELIQSLIQVLKDERKDREVVLIIDDIDRIDPDHIFRVLNVFAAHFDQQNITSSYDRKFDFDKIILVADYKNLKSIYHHKYGANTDFGGYIDKFYSSSRYELSYGEAIAQYFDTLLSDTQLQRSSHYKVVNFVLSVLFKNRSISFRTLIKNKHVFLDNERLGSALKSHEVVYQIIGDGNDAIKALNNLKFDQQDKRELLNNWHYNAGILLNEIYDHAPELFVVEGDYHVLNFKGRIFKSIQKGMSGYHIHVEFDRSDSFTLKMYFSLLKLLFQILNGQRFTLEEIK